MHADEPGWLALDQLPRLVHHRPFVGTRAPVGRVPAQIEQRLGLAELVADRTIELSGAPSVLIGLNDRLAGDRLAVLDEPDTTSTMPDCLAPSCDPRVVRQPRSRRSSPKLTQSERSRTCGADLTTPGF